MKKLLVTIMIGLFFTGCDGYSERGTRGGPPAPPRPKQVSTAERTAGTETELRSYAPADIANMAETHGGSGDR
jgi:hypothetical protein